MNKTPKITIHQPTQLLFYVAAHSPTLREFFGIEITDWVSNKFQLTDIRRPWLISDPETPTECRFDADTFALRLRTCGAERQRWMVLWILNVWSPGESKRKGWEFDLFSALVSLDSENRQAIAWWLDNPLWP